MPLVSLLTVLLLPLFYLMLEVMFAKSVFAVVYPNQVQHQQQQYPYQGQYNPNQYYPQQVLPQYLPPDQQQIPSAGQQQPVNGMLSTQMGAVETVDQNILTHNNMECSRCGMSRLIGCKKRKCYYRCYRRCHDGNGTSWDEAIRFTLHGM